MGILQVPIQSDVMFQQICQFFGPQIDPDFAIQKKILKRNLTKCTKSVIKTGYRKEKFLSKNKTYKI